MMQDQKHVADTDSGTPTLTPAVNTLNVTDKKEGKDRKDRKEGKFLVKRIQ